MVKSWLLVSALSTGANAYTAERLLDVSILMASVLLPLASVLPLYAQHGRGGIRYARWVFVVAISVAVATIAVATTMSIGFLFTRLGAASVYLCGALSILSAGLNLTLMVTGKRKIWGNSYD